MAVRHVLETHTHNDYVSGAEELAALVGADLWASGAGDGAGLRYDHRPLREGDEVPLGRVRLRAQETPGHTPEAAPLLQIAWAHVLGAFIAGVLYTALDARRLFLWVFGTFALVHLTYTFHTWLLPGTATSVGLPGLYALAVSMYTVVSFALWADLSTPEGSPAREPGPHRIRVSPDGADGLDPYGGT